MESNPQKNRTEGRHPLKHTREDFCEVKMAQGRVVTI
jgi:hypothetical protein